MPTPLEEQARRDPDGLAIDDLTRREKLIFTPLVVGTLLLGVYPSLITDIINPATTALIDQVEGARAAAQQLAMK